MDVNLMRCSRCAKQVLTSARFCPRCGSAVSRTPVVTWQERAAAEAAARPAPPPPPPRELKLAPPAVPTTVRAPQPVVRPAGKPVAKSEKSGIGGVIWIVCIVAFCAMRAGVFTSKPKPPLTTIPAMPKLSPPPWVTPNSSNWGLGAGPGPSSSSVIVTPEQTGGTRFPGYRVSPPAPPLGITGRPYGVPYTPPTPTPEDRSAHPAYDGWRWNPSAGRYEAGGSR